MDKFMDLENEEMQYVNGGDAGLVLLIIGCVVAFGMGSCNGYEGN